VARNRIKRLLREAYRLHEDKLRPGYDLILVGRHTETPASYWEVEEDFLRACRRAGLIRPEPGGHAPQGES
jgi:ribonuclease P protein component